MRLLWKNDPSETLQSVVCSRMLADHPRKGSGNSFKQPSIMTKQQSRKKTRSFLNTVMQFFLKWKDDFFEK
ncbi:hypothetical protein CR203_12570 [Salipaludibacillus neizhouensis]|uniref:Uncharacterized protein n=1 Tax=Salipaludibacillus neizhouensis TaxID=885475 RepID=A0A3A9K2U0_9BACI|nr:hypothetical protein CR203_12570 [Salipaludibacillus neizhouensis]